MPLRPGWPPPPRLLQGTLGHAPPAASPAAATLPLTTLAAPHSLHNSLCLSTPPSLCCSHSLTHYSHPLALFLPSLTLPPTPGPSLLTLSAALTHFTILSSLLSSLNNVSHPPTTLPPQNSPHPAFHHSPPIPSSTTSSPFPAPVPLSSYGSPLPLFSSPSPSPA